MSGVMACAAMMLLTACQNRSGSVDGITARYYQSDSLLFGIFAKKLAAVGEAPLGEPEAPGNERYRLIFAPSFDQSVVIRLEAIGSGAELTRTILARGKWSRHTWEPGEDPLSLFSAGGALGTTRRSLSVKEWQELKAALEQAGFWKVRRSYEATGGNDGVSLLLEGRRGTTHQVVYQWLPEGGPFVPACRKILGLADYQRADRWFQK